MKLIILTLNWLKYFFVQILYKNYYKRAYTILYFFFIRIKLKKEKNIVIVYDLSCSPDTYGDFFQYIFLLRYFELLKKKVFFIILNDKLKYCRVNKKNSLSYLNQLRKIIKKFSLKKDTEIIFTDYSFFKKKFLDNKNFILYKSKVVKRISIFQNCFNLINVIFSTLNKKVLNKILLKNKIKFLKNIINIPKNYIAIQARHLSKSEKKYNNLDIRKNINISNLKYLINLILKKRKNINLMIISTQGSNFFKKKHKIKSNKIFFSNSFAKNYLETGFLILNSKLFIAHNGSGIGLFAIFSKVPYIITWPYYTHQNDFTWSKTLNKLASWQLNKQKTYFKMSFKEYTTKVIKFLDKHEI